MARNGLPRRQRRTERLARWLEAFWACRCAYFNVATYRCHGCGRRPPRALRSEMRGVRRERGRETADAHAAP